jgi:hypothetical protein
MKLKHKNGRAFYKKTFISTMTMKEGDSKITFYAKQESLPSDRNYSDEGSPFKNTKGGEIKSIYLRYIADAYASLKVKPTQEAILDGYAKIVNAGVLFIEHDTDKVEEMPLCELLAPAPIIFLPEYIDKDPSTAAAFDGYIPPIYAIQPASQSVHMKASNQLLISYDKPLYVSPNVNLTSEIRFSGGIVIPAALVGYKLSLSYVSKIFTDDLQARAAA